MVGKKSEKIMIAEHLMEIRHGASGSFLDVRGYVADYIRNCGLLPHWSIETNVINFKDSPTTIKQEGGFAGYKSAGYIVTNPQTRNFFTDRASLFWKTLLKNEHYKIPEVTRFGARTKVFLPNTTSFNEIKDVLFSKILSSEANKLLGGDKTDLMIVIDLTEDKYNVRIVGGPMHENEVKNYFSFESDHFKQNGLYFDIDYYRESSIKHSEIPGLLDTAIKLTWTKVETIAGGLGL